MHRVRVGLIGLAWVFLLVMLATAVLHVTGGESPSANGTVAANAAAPDEPLAELGVAPGNPDGDQTAAAGRGKARSPAR